VAGKGPCKRLERIGLREKWNLNKRRRQGVEKTQHRKKKSRKSSSRKELLGNWDRAREGKRRKERKGALKS